MKIFSLSLSCKFIRFVALFAGAIVCNNQYNTLAFDSLPDDYESWTAQDKFFFWNDALEDEAEENASKSLSDRSGNFPGILGKLRFLTTDDFSPTFERFRDDLPYTHAKRIRSIGGVGLVTWHPSPDPHPYTGFFETGTSYALIRLSYTSENDESGTTPGLSLKLFRDGTPASNILAMESLAGQTSGNFFQFDFSNHLAPGTSRLLRYVDRRFSRYSCPSTRTGLSEVAFSTELINNPNPTADDYSNVNFPYRIIFRPNEALTERYASYAAERNLFDTLSTVEVGTKLYDMYAVTGPDDGSELEVHVGHLQLTRQLQPSVLGDKVLFFRHQKIEEDYSMRPQYDVQDEGARRCPAGYA